ncbi:hypothetical protein J4233_03965 [Candidatus Pacearchaeota archaeon]|nr:hypothetical protein [Candidatus Pacearchaeota archaeon]
MRKVVFIAVAVLALVLSIPIAYNFVFAERQVGLLEEVAWIVAGIFIFIVPLASLIFIKKIDFSRSKLIWILLTLNLAIILVCAFLLYVEIKSSLGKAELFY